MSLLFRGTLFLCVAISSCIATHAEELPEGLSGDWSLKLDSELPAWMRVVEEDGSPMVYLRLYIGGTGPHKGIVEDGRLKIQYNRGAKRNKDKKGTLTLVDLGMKDGKLDGTLKQVRPNGTVEEERIAGVKIPPMPKSAPDLSKVRFGHPISLFNGKDMTGWRTYETDKQNGWSAIDGMLVNTTTKTDFSPTGSYANLRTEAEFDDFWLHIEFLVEEKRNSGVYLRGMYEAQVVDRDSRMQGIQGVGAIFGTIEPKTNAGNPGGQWQTYDLTLVDRHVTVVLNGVKVIDNQPIDKPTAGAIYTNPGAPGPIYLQGDHTSVKFRDIYLAPVIKE